MFVIILKLLLEKRADIDVKNDDGQTPLIVAVTKGELEIVRLLIKKGANVNAVDDDGKTALRYASGSEMRNILKSSGAKE